MIKIGVTGGIGSGKSILCSVIERMGFPVFYSDVIAKQLLNTDINIRKDLIELFGDEVYKPNNGLDRAFLAEKIFSDKTLVQKVNAIVHPRVRAAFDEWVSKQTSSVIFNEAAILFETGSYKSFDATILVTAPEQIKIQRVIQRDKSQESEVITRMNNQWSDEKKIPLATYVVQNDDKHGVLEQVENILLLLNKGN